MKTVMVLVPRLGMGGIAKIGSFLANVMDAYGYKSICCSFVNDIATVELNDKVERITLDYDFDSCNLLPLVHRMRHKAGLLFRLRRVITDHRVDVIAALGLDMAKAALYASNGTCRVIASERGNPYRYSPKQYDKYRRVLLKADAAVFQTENAMRAFRDPDIWLKSYIIANPAIRRKRREVSVQKPLERKHRIVYCGRMSPDKNIPLLINAFASVSRRDYELYIYGDGCEYKKIADLIRKKGMTESVKIITDCEDVFQLEYDAAMLVLTSKEEGMPNALIEGLCEGIPCIATDCPPGGVRELLDHGKRGVLIPPGDQDALRDAVQCFIDDPQKAEMYGRKGRDIIDILSPERIGKSWIDIINKAVDK